MTVQILPGPQDSPKGGLWEGVAMQQSTRMLFFDKKMQRYQTNKKQVKKGGWESKKQMVMVLRGHKTRGDGELVGGRLLRVLE